MCKKNTILHIFTSYEEGINLISRKYRGIETRTEHENFKGE